MYLLSASIDSLAFLSFAFLKAAARPTSDTEVDCTVVAVDFDKDDDTEGCLGSANYISEEIFLHNWKGYGVIILTERSP